MKTLASSTTSKEEMMTVDQTGTAQTNPNSEDGGAASNSLAVHIVLCALFLTCALAIFLFGANYYKMFPTNGNLTYAAGLAAVFLAAALACRFTTPLRRYWGILYVFFVAAMVNVVSDLFAARSASLLMRLGVNFETNAGLALGKVSDTLLVVVPILVLAWLGGLTPRTLLIRKGNSSWKWGWGIGLLVLFNLFTSALIFFGTNYKPAALASAAGWGLLFGACNSFLEELWMRGLFMKKLTPLIGGAWTVILTSIWFAALHTTAVAYLPASVIPIFIVNTLTLGLTCGLLMLKTDSIWGAYLVHAAADLFLFIATLAVH
jgi:membrane protease YdiL (CAAX protease family)